jgi:hypothetical protein
MFKDLIKQLEGFPNVRDIGIMLQPAPAMLIGTSTLPTRPTFFRTNTMKLILGTLSSLKMSLYQPFEDFYYEDRILEEHLIQTMSNLPELHLAVRTEALEVDLLQGPTEVMFQLHA